MSVAMPAQPAIGFGRPFTRADLDAMPDDGRRYELIDGVLVVSAAPGLRHQVAVVELSFLLRGACPPGFRVLVAPFAVVLADDTELQPDLLVARRTDLTERDLPRPPVLAVEVLSHSTRFIDRNVKRARFERAGVPTFWIVEPAANPAQARLEVWELTDAGRYRLAAEAVGEQSYRARTPYPVAVRPADLVR
jgi:Uma2 family endonuclease